MPKPVDTPHRRKDLSRTAGEYVHYLRARQSHSPSLPQENQERRAFLHLIGIIFWLGGISLVQVVTFDPTTRLMITSAATLLFGLWGFFKLGGELLTAAGIYCICVALFAGFAGIYWALESPHPGYISKGVWVIHCTTVSAYYIFWKNNDQAPILPPFPEENTRGAAALGALLFGMGGILSRFAPMSHVWTATAFAGVTILSAALIATTRQSVRLFTFGSTAVAVILYIEFIFVGFGRLTLAALGFAVLFIATARYRTYYFKIGTIAALPFALTYFIQQREEFGKATYGESLDGIGSVVNPLKQFATLLQDVDSIDLTWGHTFYAAIVQLIPSEIWPGKPDGFGLILAEMYNPEIASLGVTYVALIHGEFIFNFHIWGIIIFIFAIGFALNVIDKIIQRNISKGIDNRVALLAFTAAALTIGGVTDVTWGGFHLFVGRTGLRLIIVFILIFVWAKPLDALQRSEKSRADLPAVPHHGRMPPSTDL